MPKDRVEAVERAFTVLETFSKPGEELTLNTISERTGFYKSTILRTAGSLLEKGYLVRKRTGEYRLGPSLWRLGTLYRKEFLPDEAVRPILRTLSECSGETSSFFVRDGSERVCLYRENSNKPIRHHLDEGTRLPLGSGAVGKLISAFTDLDDPQYSAIRSDGHAISVGERISEIAAIAVPMFTADGEFAGAVALSGLADHFDSVNQAKYVTAMKRAVKEHSDMLPALQRVAGAR